MIIESKLEKKGTLLSIDELIVFITCYISIHYSVKQQQLYIDW
jgi:hypothetical protein